MNSINSHNNLIIEILSFDYGKAFGYQEYIFNLLNYFKEHRNDINYKHVLIICKHQDINFFLKYKPELDIQSFKINNAIEKYITLNTLSFKLKLSSQDCILFTNNYSSLIKRCKHVLVIHDLLYLRPNYMPNKLFRIQRHLFIPRSIYLADKVIGITNWVKEDIVTQFKIRESNKVTAIYNYFNFKKYNIEQASQEVKDYCYNNRYFLVVSSNARHKNLDKILDAFNIFCSNNQTIKLLFIGKITGYVKEKYNTLSTQVQNRISNMYNISNADLGYLYIHANAFISATLFEGLGMPIVEALYFNTPALVSNIDVVKEVTLGKAEYFAPNDINSLANLMQSKVQSVRLNTSNDIKRIYSTQNTVAKYIDLLNNI